MTFANFRTRVIQYAGESSKNMIEVADTTALNSFINERRGDFARRAYSHYDPRVTLTLTVDQHNYDFENTSTAFGKKMITVEDVTIDDVPLINGSSRPGGSGIQEVFDLDRTWQTASSGRPKRFIVMPPKTLYLLPKPDSAYSDCYVSGFIVPTALSADGDVLTEPEDLLDAMAQFIAAKVIGNSRSHERWEEGQDMLAWSLAEAEKFRAIAQRQLGGSRVRGGRRTPGWRRIGV